MKKNGNHLCYNHKPITSLEGLALALKMNKDVLCEIAGTADKYWRQLPPIIKSDGKQRLIFDARPVLKAIHGRINKEILSRVVFPEYITGGVKGRDYTANARFHIKKVIVITEDIQSFFPSTNSSVVYDIWKNFFKFSPEVASLLTLLTTKEGTLPQGGKCSPYLANLVFWDKEPLLFEDFKGQGLQYSRFVDDITVSSSRHLNNSEKSQVISAVFSMLHSKGYSPKREKHEIQTQGSRILVTKLVTNDKVSLTRQQRSNLRAALYQLENRIQKGERGLEIAAQVNSLGAKVGQLNRFHKRQGSELRKRLRMLREVLRACPIQNTTYPTEEIESYSGPEMPF